MIYDYSSVGDIKEIVKDKNATMVSNACQWGNCFTSVFVGMDTVSTMESVIKIVQVSKLYFLGGKMSLPIEIGNNGRLL